MTVRVVQCAACFRIGLLPPRSGTRPNARAGRSSTCKNPLAQDEARRARTLWRNERTSGAAPLAGLARAELHRRGDHDVLGDHGVGTLKVLPHVSAASHRASTTAGPPPPTARSRSSRQRFAAAFRTDKASPRVRCLHPAAATHVCASYRSGAPRKASPRTARRRHTLPNASPLRAAATLSRAAATSPCSGFPPLAFHTPYSNAVREQGDPCHEHGPYL